MPWSVQARSGRGRRSANRRRRAPPRPACRPTIEYPAAARVPSRSGFLRSIATIEVVDSVEAQGRRSRGVGVSDPDRELGAAAVPAGVPVVDVPGRDRRLMPRRALVALEGCRDGHVGRGHRAMSQSPRTRRPVDGTKTGASTVGAGARPVHRPAATRIDGGAPRPAGLRNGATRLPVLGSSTNEAPSTSPGAAPSEPVASTIALPTTRSSDVHDPNVEW